MCTTVPKYEERSYLRVTSVPLEQAKGTEPEGSRREDEGETTRRFQSAKTGTQDREPEHITLPRATLPAHEEREAN